MEEEGNGEVSHNTNLLEFEEVLEEEKPVKTAQNEDLI